MQSKRMEIELNQLLGVVFLLVIIGIGTAIGIDVLVGVRDGFTTGSTEFHAVANAIEGVNEIPKKMKTIGLVVVAAVLITLLTSFLFARVR